MAVYQFNVEHACQWGVNEAIFLQNLIYWLRKNKAEGRNVRMGEDGVTRVWTFSTTTALAKLYPFWKAHQVRYVIDSLRKQEVLVTAQFADQAFDRTLWFALTDEALLEMPDLPDAPGEMAGRGKNLTADRFEKFLKSKRNKSQIHLTNSSNGSAEILTSLKETNNSSISTETDTAAEDMPALPISELVSKASAVALPPEDARNTNGGGGERDIFTALLVAGLNRADAQRLVVASPDECRRQLDYLPHVAAFTSSRGAYLRTAIEQGFAPPPGWINARQQEEAQERERQTTDKTRSTFEEKRAKEALRQMALEAEKQRLQCEEPERWAALVTQAEGMLPPPLKGKTGHVAYGPALAGNIERLLQPGKTS